MIGIAIATLEDRLQLYKVLQEEYPRSHVCKRIPLNFTSGEIFRQLMEAFLRPSLHKGVPSLFIGLKGLYKDPDKVGGPCCHSVLCEEVHVLL